MAWLGLVELARAALLLRLEYLSGFTTWLLILQKARTVVYLNFKPSQEKIRKASQPVSPASIIFHQWKEAFVFPGILPLSVWSFFCSATLAHNHGPLRPPTLEGIHHVHRQVYLSVLADTAYRRLQARSARSRRQWQHHQHHHHPGKRPQDL